MAEHPILPGRWREKSKPENIGEVTQVKNGQVCWRTTTIGGNLRSALMGTMQFFERFEKVPTDNTSCPTQPSGPA